MQLVLVFAGVLVVAILVSELAGRSVLSTAVLFLVAGFVAGEGMVGVIRATPGDEITRSIAELALFAVLFTDGMRAGIGRLTSAWRLPGRALLLGLPLTLLITAGLAWGLTDLPWTHALLVGAVLSPTDPVFASALIGRKGVPPRLSHLLNVESGVNDGLALPVVLALLATIADRPPEYASLAGEILLGIAVGVVVPFLLIRLEQTRFFSASAEYEPLYPFAIGALIFGICSLTHANLFLAAFAAGVTVTSISARFSDAFQRFGHLLSELLKLLAILVFGALISPQFLSEVSVTGYVFAVLALIVARPLALAVSFFRSGIERREWWAAAWFGPKGFASVLYGLLVLHAQVPNADKMFHLVAIVIVLSILAHSSTDVLVARRFGESDI